MVQEVHTTSWFKRIINALWGVFFGIILIVGAIVLVFWNEGHGLHTAQALQQVQSILISVPNSPIDTKNDKRVIYFSGVATTKETLHDDIFNLSDVAIKLSRQVEMYQWKQDTETRTEKNLGGSEQETKTYTYKKVWSSELIDSANFKDPTDHQNPATMPIQSTTQYANKVMVGDFVIPSQLITRISGDKNIDLSQVDINGLQTKYNRPVRHDGTDLYFGANSAAPAIGDVRITLTEVIPQTVSIIAQQSGTTLQPFLADSGQAVSLIEMGQVSPQQMIQTAKSENSTLTWVLRFVSLLGLIVGFMLIMAPVVVLADVVPLFGSLVGFGTGMIALICGLTIWLVAIAIAWFVVRPLLSLGLIILAGIIFYLLYAYRKKSKMVVKS